ncbi:hypothetical protein BO70DRAFT_406795 [Aspergillus heteromorphus CBS 117.55]|uniref:Uncharacterized protein n=1 Tax=Aspergillus heteromorphus CBS 117.55 TaxID=1448321 RepID=A0A317ULN5_9EURO|nr:hypothetical protein BO70DRAFT_406795 [Aspergillus heteromorphus CBS 117.55]
MTLGQACPPGIPGGAMCVQRLDDSLNSAIHISYRISLRSSSMPEPRESIVENSVRVGVFGGHGPGGRAPRRPTGGGPAEATCTVDTGGRLGPKDPHSVMILPQVHLRKPCYDFYFL